MKDFIPYNESLELKELGFDEESLGLFSRDKVFVLKWIPNQQECEEYFGGILTPTYSQAFRFFREKYKMIHQIYSLKYKDGVNYDYEIFSLVPPTDDELGNESDVATDKSMETYDSLVDKNFKHDESETYEDAEFACLQKLIEIVNKNI